MPERLRSRIKPRLMPINDYVVGRAVRPAGLTRRAPAAEDFCHSEHAGRKSARIRRAAANGRRQMAREQA
jgi:hypothetical protein